MCFFSNPRALDRKRATATITVLLGVALCVCLSLPTAALAFHQDEGSGSDILIVPRSKGPVLDAGDAPFPIVPRTTPAVGAEDPGILIVPRPPQPETSGPSLAPDPSEPQGATPLRPTNVRIAERSLPRPFYPTPYRTFYGRYGVRFNLWWRRVPLFYHPFQFSYPPYYPQWTLPYPY